MPTRRVNGLKVHPFNIEVYGKPDDGLAESLEQFGLQYAVEIDEGGQILSGARRWSGAKKLGWTDIEVRVVKAKSEEGLRRHILLANAYRATKAVFIRQKEADAYHDLLDRGQFTREDLVGLAKQHGKAPSTPEDLKPKRLAAAAAGMSASTYRQAAFVTDPGRGEAEIERAKKEKLISPAQASSLKQKLKGARGDFRAGSDQRGSSGWRNPKGHPRSESRPTDTRRRRERNGLRTWPVWSRSGEAGLFLILSTPLDMLSTHVIWVRELPFSLRGSYTKPAQALQGLAKKGKLTLPTEPAELAKHAKAIE